MYTFSLLFVFVFICINLSYVDVYDVIEMDCESISTNFTSVSQRAKNNLNNNLKLSSFINIPSESGTSKCLRFLNHFRGNNIMARVSKASEDTEKVNQNTTSLINGTVVENTMSNNCFDKISSDTSSGESLFDENINLKHLNKLYCATSTPRSQNKSSAQSVEMKRVNEIFIAFNHFKSLNPSIIENNISTSSEKSEPSIENKKRFLYNKLDNILKNEESEDKQRSLLNKLLNVMDEYETERENRDSGNMTALTDTSVGTTPKQYTKDKPATITPRNGNKKRRYKKKSELFTFSLRFKNNKRKNEGSSDNKENKSKITLDKTQKGVSNDASTSLNMNKRASAELQKNVPKDASTSLNMNKRSSDGLQKNVLKDASTSLNMNKRASAELQKNVSKDASSSLNVNKRASARLQKKVPKDQLVMKENRNKRNSLPILDKGLKDVHKENTNRRCSLRLQNQVPKVRLNKHDLYLQQFLREGASNKIKTSPKIRTPKSKRKHCSNCFDRINLTATSKKRRLYSSETWLSSLANCSSES